MNCLRFHLLNCGRMKLTSSERPRTHRPGWLAPAAVRALRPRRPQHPPVGQSAKPFAWIFKVSRLHFVKTYIYICTYIYIYTYVYVHTIRMLRMMVVKLCEDELCSKDEVDECCCEGAVGAARGRRKHAQKRRLQLFYLLSQAGLCNYS